MTNTHQSDPQQSVGVPASPSGYSAEPEPSCTVSAVPVSIPNAAWTATSGYRHYPPYVNLTGNRLTIREAERDGAIGDQYFIEPGRTVFIDLPNEALEELASAIEARRAATGNTDAVHESAVAKPDAQSQSSGDLT